MLIVTLYTFALPWLGKNVITQDLSRKCKCPGNIEILFIWYDYNNAHVSDINLPS